MKTLKILAVAAALALGAPALVAQNSFPAPGGGGGNSAPAPGSGGSFRPNGGFGAGPGVPPPTWGNPWNNNFGGPMSGPNWANSGTMTVLGCGYDAQGIWRTIPLRVAYQYNGIQYNVRVLNAWNPWSDMWNMGVDQPAYNTSYYINGNTYDFYAPLSTGTYYFNL
ncbi:MAG: hypothetical protein HDS31_01995 [Bacteroides sp.]|nr:hypothetical protein [Bacteroides sp.]